MFDKPVFPTLLLISAVFAASPARSDDGSLEKLMSFEVDHNFERQYSSQHLASYPCQAVFCISIKRLPQNNQ